MGVTQSQDRAKQLERKKRENQNKNNLNIIRSKTP